MIAGRWRRRIGGLVWAAGATIAVAWGVADHQASQQVRGLGRSFAIDLAAAEHGRLESVDVDLHDPVRVGQVVARFDARAVIAERDAYAAEVLAVADANRSDGVAAVAKQYDRQKEIAERVEIARLEAEVRRMEALFQDQAATQAEVAEARADLQRARGRIAPPDVPDDEPTNDWWIAAALGRMAVVEERLRGLDVVSTLEGRVEAVYRRPGEFVTRGDPVVRVRTAETREVIAWVPAGREPEPGAIAVIARADGTRLTGAVLSVGDGPTALPLNALVDPTRQEWGVAVRLQLQDGLVGPDEPVVVRL